jgi:DNA-binding NarL/FixJ family response regulator
MRVPRIGPLHPADLALAGVLFGLGQAETWVPFRTSLGHGSATVAALIGAAMTLPLAARRSRPVLVALLVALPVPIVGAVTSVRLLFFAGFLPLLIVTYTLASRATALAALALPFGTLLVAEVEVPGFRKPGEIVFDWLWFGVAAAVGLVVRHRSLRAERSESRVATLESERELVLRAERARIARELHDVIAHSVSVIVVQAGAAEPLVEEDPEQARAALRSIRSTAGEALGEMRRLLGILRTADDELALDPQPSVARLEPLLGQARFDLDDYLVEAFRAGASGFLLKDVLPVDLLHAVRVVSRGEALLAPALTRRLLEEHVERARVPSVDGGDPFGELTERELEVANAIARGLSNAEIGAQLYLSEATVKTHVTRVLAKLGVRDRVQIVVAAYERGLVRPGES